MADKIHLAYKIDTHAQSTLLTPSTALDHALTNSHAAGLPAITISPLQGQYLAIQARVIGAKSVLEIGTLGGYSTIWFASTGASVTSIEINPKHRDVAMGNISKAGFDGKVDVILGAALEVLPKLGEEGKKFDLVFIDADWGEQWEYFEWAMKLVPAGGCIIVDNVVREILEHEDEGEADSLLTKIGKAEGVVASLVPTLSSHKQNAEDMFDGFVIAVVGSK